MSQESNFLMLSTIKSILKRYKSILIYAFIAVLVIGSIPFIYKSSEKLRLQKLIQKQRKIEIQNKEKICKDDKSEYKKFLNLGFPKTAIEKFNFCMKEQ